MLADANALSTGDLDGRTFDVCICGGGAAGITLALALARRELSVVLLEGGGLEASSESQGLYAGRNVGHEYFDLDATRLRFFGGTSNHWQGLCRPLDPFDFAAAPAGHGRGWPIGYDEVAPYVEAAREIVDIPADSSPLVMPSNRFGPDLLEVGFWQSRMHNSDGTTEPTRFGRKYGDAVRREDRITGFINANVVDIVLNDALSSVEYVVVRNFAHDRPIAVRARHFVLALGGLENPRLLLNCNRQMRVGIGNGRDLVGRYFCDHPQLPIGFGVVNEETFRPDRTVYVGPTAAFLRRSNIRNFTLQVILEDTFGSTGTKRWIQELACMMPFATRLEMAYSGEFPHWWCDFRLVVVTEQALNRDSRVKLGEPVDRFGHRRIDLDWRLTDLDFRTMRLAGLRLAETFADADLGRIRLDDWILRDDVTLPPLREVSLFGAHHMCTTKRRRTTGVGMWVSLFGAHHMCTTRMSDRPETGVVDENGTVFGLANLHIVGSSVFATPGCANPTLTIVQMALRQADLLAAQSKI